MLKAARAEARAEAPAVRTCIRAHVEEGLSAALARPRFGAMATVAPRDVDLCISYGSGVDTAHVAGVAAGNEIGGVVVADVAIDVIGDENARPSAALLHLPGDGFATPMACMGPRPDFVEQNDSMVIDVASAGRKWVVRSIVTSIDPALHRRWTLEAA